MEENGVMLSASREPWETLFEKAMVLIDEASIKTQIEWSLGGGTVLMFQLHHRRSKDIDIFIEDPQLLGMFSPRLSDRAFALTDTYSEESGSLKLIFPEGEIDFIIASPLTPHPFAWEKVKGTLLKLETPAEIVAKKLWHRGHLATGRDLFDLAAVVHQDPSLLTEAHPAMTKNAAVFLDQCQTREKVVRAQYEAIDTLDFELNFNESLEIAVSVLAPLID